MTRDRTAEFALHFVTQETPVVNPSSDYQKFHINIFSHSTYWFTVYLISVTAKQDGVTANQFQHW